MKLPLLLRPATKLALAGLILFWAETALAQTTSLSLWPPVFTAMVKPGKSVTQVYRLKNAADDTTIKASVVPISPSDELGHFDLQFGGKLPGFFSLLNTDLPTTFTLRGGQTRELMLKITIPAGAQDADYPAALVIESKSQGLIGGSGSVSQATIAAPILLTISQTGQPQRLAKIEEFSAKNIFDSFEPIKPLLRVKNQSATHLQPVGSIKIINALGRKTATLSLKQQNILGGSIRQIQSDAWDPIFPFGRYTAVAELAPMDTNNTVSQTIIFWVLPYKLLLVILVFTVNYYFFNKIKIKK